MEQFGVKDHLQSRWLPFGSEWNVEGGEIGKVFGKGPTGIYQQLPVYDLLVKYYNLNSTNPDIITIERSIGNVNVPELLVLQRYFSYTSA